MYYQHHAPSPLPHLVLPRLPLRMRSEQQAGCGGVEASTRPWWRAAQLPVWRQHSPCRLGYPPSTCHRRAVPPRYVRAMRAGGGHRCCSTPIIALCEAGAPQEGFPASSLLVEVVPQRVSKW
eukprot:COSAG01_NODE_3097_length_6590_cov_20.121707_2_plen_122_part_00